jgi:hypothetical protein
MPINPVFLRYFRGFDAPERFSLTPASQTESGNSPINRPPSIVAKPAETKSNYGKLVVNQSAELPRKRKMGV